MTIFLPAYSCSSNALPPVMVAEKSGTKQFNAEGVSATVISLIIEWRTRCSPFRPGRPALWNVLVNSPRTANVQVNRCFEWSRNRMPLRDIDILVHANQSAILRIWGRVSALQVQHAE